MEDELRRKLEDLIESVDEAHQRLTAGLQPDIMPLERDVDAICKAVKSAPSEIAKNLQPVIADLISRLDRLEEELETFKSDLETRRR